MLMTFRHTLYISIAAHILVFGSAIAFARYGSGLFLVPPGIIQVALVSPDPQAGSGNKAGPASNRTALPQAEQTTEERSVETAKKTPAEKGTALDEAPAPETGAAQESRIEGREGAGTTASLQGGGQEASDQTGVSASGEWSALAAAIEKTKSYPRIARERGIEGEVRLRFRLTPSGSIEKIEIIRSSGYEILDKASIGAVYRAVPLPYLSGWVEMPMRFELKP